MVITHGAQPAIWLLHIYRVLLCRCGMGLDGAAIAWDCVQCTSLCGLILYILWFNRQQESSKRTWHGCGYLQRPSFL